MFDQVIIPLDGSEVAERALEYGTAIAEKFAVPVVLVRAYEGEQQTTRMLAMMPADPGGGVVDPNTIQAVEDAAKTSEQESRTYLDAVAARLTASGLNASTVLMDSPAAAAILDVAHRQPDALVVMCTHGRGGLERLVFGSVAQEVLRKARNPLVLVRVQEAPVEEAQSDRSNQSGGTRGVDIKIGADVVGTDGKLGEVHRVIVDARDNTVTDLVVKHGFIWGNERILPLAQITGVENGDIKVNMDEKAFEKLAGFTDDRYRAPDPQYDGPPGFDNPDFLMDTMVAEGSAGGYGTALPPMGFPGGQQISPDDTSRPAIEPGTPVLSADGEKIGEVHEVSIAADTGKPDQIVVRRGFLFHHDTTIPADLIKEISDDGILLSKTKSEIEALGQKA